MNVHHRDNCADNRKCHIGRHYCGSRIMGSFKELLMCVGFRCFKCKDKLQKSAFCQINKNVLLYVIRLIRHRIRPI